jgi:hypothetical protein
MHPFTFEKPAETRVPTNAIWRLKFVKLYINFRCLKIESYEEFCQSVINEFEVGNNKK